MKKIPQFIILSIIAVLITISCSKNESTVLPITGEEEQLLKYMLEEEKLARDVYDSLYVLWSLNQFNNISNSEQSHMNAIANLLDKNNISYTLLNAGAFNDTTIQRLYDQLMTQGKVDILSALQVGATIEDLDIVDLQEILDITNNTDIKTVLNKLQCGSRNHLRSYNTEIVNRGSTYVPQFLTTTEFNTIINNSHEQCN